MKHPPQNEFEVPKSDWRAIPVVSSAEVEVAKIFPLPNKKVYGQDQVIGEMGWGIEPEEIVEE